MSTFVYCRCLCQVHWVGLVLFDGIYLKGFSVSAPSYEDPPKTLPSILCNLIFLAFIFEEIAAHNVGHMQTIWSPRKTVSRTQFFNATLGGLLYLQYACMIYCCELLKDTSCI